MAISVVMIVVGTRPEIVKMIPIVKALRKSGLGLVIVHTGQHYDYNMSVQFFDELGLSVDHYLRIGRYSPIRQTGNVLMGLERILTKEKPHLMLVEGDTNTVLAAALAGNKLNIPVGHVEAGLRSFDLRMPEEHNRRLVDHISAHLFAPTSNAKANLERESVWGKIYVTGNTVVDAVNYYMPLAKERSKIQQQVLFKEYILATMHRAENVDDPEVMKNFVEVVINTPVPIVFPAHPRTVKRLKQFKLWRTFSLCKNIQILPPMGYLDFLVLMKNCKMILTDSGGLQEEATTPTIRKKVLIFRLSTERLEAVEKGFARIVGLDAHGVITAIKEELANKSHLPKTSPFGDGRSGERIANIILEIK